jgi:hypothetical protein
VGDNPDLEEESSSSQGQIKLGGMFRLEFTPCSVCLTATISVALWLHAADQ